MNNHRTYTVRLHQAEKGYWSEVVGLPGCFSQGDTFRECWDNTGEAIEMVEEKSPR